MARKVSAFLMTVCLLFTVDAEAMTGNDWVRLPQTAQQYYVFGVLDAWENFGEVALRLNQQSSVVTNFTKLVTCGAGMTYGQINAIVQKYMENNPANWHYSMPSLVWTALDGMCAPASK